MMEATDPHHATWMLAKKLWSFFVLRVIGSRFGLIPSRVAPRNPGGSTCRVKPVKKLRSTQEENRGCADQPPSQCCCGEPARPEGYEQFAVWNAERPRGGMR